MILSSMFLSLSEIKIFKIKTSCNGGDDFTNLGRQKKFTTLNYWTYCVLYVLETKPFKYWHTSVLLCFTLLHFRYFTIWRQDPPPPEITAHFIAYCGKDPQSEVCVKQILTYLWLKKNKAKFSSLDLDLKYELCVLIVWVIIKPLKKIFFDFRERFVVPFIHAFTGLFSSKASLNLKPWHIGMML